DVCVERIRPHIGCDRRSGPAAAPAATDQAADGDKMRADAACEGGADAGELEIELCVHDGRLGSVDGCLRAALVGGTLIDVLRAAKFGLLELPGAPELRC